MKKLSHKNETARLEKLRSLEILDSPPERVFDRVTRMAARIYGLKIAAISFVDEHRVWHKARCGLRGSREVFRDVSFCTQTIRADEVLAVRDTTKDLRFAHLPAVKGDRPVRFYAGAPLKTSDGHRLGALCVVGHEPRIFTKVERSILADLAAIVVDELRLRHLAGQLHTEAANRKDQAKVLVKQHRLLQRLSGSLEDGIRQRTSELTQANETLTTEIHRREVIERDRFNLLNLIEESPDLIGLCAIDGQPRYVNRAGRELVGLESLEQVARTAFDDYFLPEDLAFVNETILHAVREKGQWEGDFRFRHFKTGQAIPVSWNVFYARDPATGEPVSLAAIARDITERQRADTALRESEERFRHLVEQAGEAFFVCDLEGFIVDVNQEACDSLGYRREELLGLPVAAVETTFDASEALPRWQAWKQGQAVSTRGIHRRKDRTTFAVEARVSSFRTDGKRYMLALARDVTERHRAEAALNKAKEEAEKANRAKSEFLSRMSHELRTPLNAILGFGQILFAQTTDATQKDCANHVVNAGNHLLDLINEVLDISRIEAGKVDFTSEPVRVENLVAETLDLVRPQAQARRIAFEVVLGGCGSHHLFTDRQRCKQALLNLLSNAVNYSPEGGSVKIECRAVRPKALRICVIDKGPGIKAEKMERLFVAFDRLGAERSAIPGTGLGLALSKHLIEAMGGSIGATSVPGQGSTFWLQLPRHHGTVQANFSPLLPMLIAGERKMAAQNGTTAPKPDECTVLYIEDNASNLRLVERLLSHLPHLRLLTAHTGEEGLEQARRHQPHLILLDVHLPDLPGWEVLSHLQSSQQTCHIPVVAISADATPDAVERLMVAGAHAYLTKPLNLENFYQILPGLGLLQAHDAVGPSRAESDQPLPLP